MQHFDLI